MRNKLMSYLLKMTILPFFAFGQLGSVTQGLGTVTQSNLLPSCPSNHVTPLGIISSSDGIIWDVPGSVNYNSNLFLTDLYNSCNSVIPTDLTNVNTSSVPLHVLDNDGDTITGFLFCDNYFELYVNGILLGVDAVPFTPFNSSIVRFKVSKPYTISVKLIDWEENIGLGSEIQASTNYHPGDGGFIAKFSDGTQTDSTWKAQVYYIAPLEDPNSVIELANHIRSTATATNSPTCNNNCYGIHFPIDTNWIKADFDDSSWPNAFLYNASQVTNQPAYTNFASSAWSNTPFIWTSNLILDNLVLARKTVTSSTNLISRPMNSGWLQPQFIDNTIKLINTDIKHNIRFTISDMLGRSINEWNFTTLEANEIVRLSLANNTLNNQLLLLQIKSSESVQTFKLVNTE